jgi:arylsulfatase A-like enzyme
MPNLVVIMADDLSVDVLGAVLDAGLMPNLKSRLMDDGVTFDNAFVTDPICCPSRATFLRGQYAHNHGVLSNISNQPGKGGIAWPGWFPEGGRAGKNESTIATWLQGGGYTTGHIGKYLNGYGDYAPDGVADPKTYIPPGWNDWQGLIDPTTYKVYDYEMNDNGAVVAYGGDVSDYQTDVLAGRAVQFIQARALAGETFFLNVTPLAPHVEILDLFATFSSNDPKASFSLTIRPAPRHEVFTNGDPVDGEVPSLASKPSFNEIDMSDKPSCPRPDPPAGFVWVAEPLCVGDRPLLENDPDISNVEAQYKDMAASLLAVDNLIGTVLDALTVNDILDETVVVFTSDNGWNYGEHRLVGKQVPYEESIRVPLIVRAPGFASGATASQLVLNNDLAPTLAELGGVSPPYDPDGMSLLPLLSDPARGDWPRKRFLIENWFVPSISKFENPSFSAVRFLTDSTNFLYVAWRTDPENTQMITDRVFYRLASDPFQRQGMHLGPNVTDPLDRLVSIFRKCIGQTCRHLESF